VNTGLIKAADNEAQIAGVLAHEISHVALRHGTNQASKAQIVQVPTALAGSMMKSGSMLGQLSQMGIGLGANSVLLKFSRQAESQADLLGTQIMAKAGYQPVEMARFFQKLEEQGGAHGPQFLSDHPNPGNRVQAVQAEVAKLPKQNYSTGDANQLAQMKAAISKVKVPPKPNKQQ
jgi:beta-barrel assembly-enhancing protease